MRILFLRTDKVRARCPRLGMAAPWVGFPRSPGEDLLPEELNRSAIAQRGFRARLYSKASRRTSTHRERPVGRP